MTRKRVVLIAAAAVTALAVLAWLGFFNRLVGENVAHPPCEQLPSRADVAQAIAEHNSLADRLTAVGDGVEVIVGNPCPDPDQALVMVRVATAKDEASVREVLGNSDGFGVPSVVERS
jgi:hypothetical protein